MKIRPRFFNLLFCTATFLCAIKSPLSHASTTEDAPFNALQTSMICSDQCQRWDGFNQRCTYRTSCVIDQNLVTYKQCFQWDNFNNRCSDERISRQYLNFDPFTGSPVCTESCQYHDGFGTCLYRSTCVVMQHCASIKYCERWDSFNHVCQSEKVDYACNLRP